MRDNCERFLQEFGRSPKGLNGFSDILPWRVPPQSFQIVESPVFWREDMDDEVGIIHQNPLRLAVAFDMVRGASLFLQPQMDFIGNSLILRRGGSGTNDEAVSERGDSPHIHQGQIKRFLLLGSVNGTLHKFVVNLQGILLVHIKLRFQNVLFHIGRNILVNTVSRSNRTTNFS